jgi:hypothetical protein
MTTYIQFNGDEGLETVDEFSTYKEAKEALKDYLALGGYYYLSNRACKEWREASQSS